MTTILFLFPWLLSAITILVNWMAGSNHKWTWDVGLANCALWTAWIFATGEWGFLPMTIAVALVFYRNRCAWRAIA